MDAIFAGCDLSGGRILSKVKTMCIHPTLPYVATASEDGHINLWDYTLSSHGALIKHFTTNQLLAQLAHPQNISSRVLLRCNDHNSSALMAEKGTRLHASAASQNLGLSSDDNRDEKFLDEFKLSNIDSKIGEIKDIKFYDSAVLYWEGYWDMSNISYISTKLPQWIIITCEFRIFLIDVISLECRTIILNDIDRQNPTCCIPLTPSLIGIGCIDGNIRIWDAQNWVKVNTLMGGHQKEIIHLNNVKKRNDYNDDETYDNNEYKIEFDNDNESLNTYLLNSDSDEYDSDIEEQIHINLKKFNSKSSQSLQESGGEGYIKFLSICGNGIGLLWFSEVIGNIIENIWPIAMIPKIKDINNITISYSLLTDTLFIYSGNNVIRLWDLTIFPEKLEKSARSLTITSSIDNKDTLANIKKLIYAGKFKLQDKFTGIINFTYPSLPLTSFLAYSNKDSIITLLIKGSQKDSSNINSYDEHTESFSATSDYDGTIHHLEKVSEFDLRDCIRYPYPLSSTNENNNNLYQQNINSTLNLPSKLYILTLKQHPLYPHLILCGTNIGLFTLSFSPKLTDNWLAIHPSWGDNMIMRYDEGTIQQGTIDFDDISLLSNKKLLKNKKFKKKKLQKLKKIFHKKKLQKLKKLKNNNQNEITSLKSFEKIDIEYNKLTNLGDGISSSLANTLANITKNQGTSGIMILSTLSSLISKFPPQLYPSPSGRLIIYFWPYLHYYQIYPIRKKKNKNSQLKLGRVVDDGLASSIAWCSISVKDSSLRREYSNLYYRNINKNNNNENIDNDNINNKNNKKNKNNINKQRTSWLDRLALLEPLYEKNDQNSSRTHSASQAKIFGFRKKKTTNETKPIYNFEFDIAGDSSSSKRSYSPTSYVLVLKEFWSDGEMAKIVNESRPKLPSEPLFLYGGPFLCIIMKSLSSPYIKNDNDNTNVNSHIPASPSNKKNRKRKSILMTAAHMLGLQNEEDNQDTTTTQQNSLDSNKQNNKFAAVGYDINSMSLPTESSSSFLSFYGGKYAQFFMWVTPDDENDDDYYDDIDDDDDDDDDADDDDEYDDDYNDDDSDDSDIDPMKILEDIIEEDDEDDDDDNDDNNEKKSYEHNRRKSTRRKLLMEKIIGPQLRSLGGPLPDPGLICWDDKGEKCAYIVGHSNRVIFFFETKPIFRIYATASINIPPFDMLTSAIWSFNSLFVSSLSQIWAIFPCGSSESDSILLATSYETTPSSFSLLGMSPQGKLSKFEALGPGGDHVVESFMKVNTYAKPPSIAKIIGIKNKYLIFSSFNGQISYLKINSLFLRIALLVMANAPEKAIRFSRLLHPSLHPNFVRFLEKHQYIDCLLPWMGELFYNTWKNKQLKLKDDNDDDDNDDDNENNNNEKDDKNEKDDDDERDNDNNNDNNNNNNDELKDDDNENLTDSTKKKLKKKKKKKEIDIKEPLNYPLNISLSLKIEICLKHDKVDYICSLVEDDDKKENDESFLSDTLNMETSFWKVAMTESLRSGLGEEKDGELIDGIDLTERQELSLVIRVTQFLLSHEKYETVKSMLKSCKKYNLLWDAYIIALQLEDREEVIELAEEIGLLSIAASMSMLHGQNTSDFSKIMRTWKYSLQNTNEGKYAQVIDELV